MKTQEQIKEEVKVKTENRKDRKQIEKDLQNSNNLLKILKDSEKMLDKYSKKSLGGTGPLSTAGGLTKYISQSTEDLDSKFNELSLDTVTKMFAGMSKAIDTGAERAIFESSQPNIKNDDAVNKRILKDRIKAVQSLIEKQKNAYKGIDREGNFVDVPQQPTKQVVRKQYSKSANKTKLVYDDGSEEILDGKQ